MPLQERNDHLKFNFQYLDKNNEWKKYYPTDEMLCSGYMCINYNNTFLN